MFYRNVEARDYEITIVFDPTLITRTSLDETNLAGYFKSSFIGDFVQVDYLATVPVSSSSWTTSLTLSGGVLSASPVSTGSMAKATLRLVLTNVLVTVDQDCDAWTFEADQVDLYYKWGSGSESLFDSASSVSLSGSGYDARQNYCAEVDLDPDGVFPATVTCAASYAAQTTGAVSATIKGTGQWRWRENSGPGAWQYEDVDLENPTVPSVGSGGCGAACIADPAEIHGTSSQEIYVTTDVSYALTKGGLYSQYCPCPGPGTGGTYDIWDADYDYQRRSRRFRMDPENAGIRETYREWDVSRTCSGGGPYTDTGNSTTTELHTVGEYLYGVSVRDLHRSCHAETIAPLCIPVMGGSYSYCGPADTLESCVYDADGSLTHPSVPPCLGGTWVSTDSGFDRRHLTAYDAVPSGMLTTWIQDQALGTGEVTSSELYPLDGEIRIQLRDDQAVVRLVTVEGGSILIRESTDWGRTFGSSTSVGSGTLVTSDIGQNGIQYVYYITGSGPYDITGRRYDRALSALEAAFVAVSGVDNISPAVSASSYNGNNHRVILRYWVGGVLTTKTSIDGVTFI